MNRILFALTGLILLGYITLTATVFAVDEREWAILFRFGEIVRTDFEPGLHFKLPVAQTISKFDKRIQTLEVPAVRYQTAELKNVIVDAFVKWRINDVKKYYVAIGAGDIDARLSQNINDLSRSEFGARTVREVVSGDRSKIMSVLKERSNEFSDQFGVEILDVRIKRVDLPKEVSNSVFQRMEAERTRVAKDLRAKGGAKAEQIRANADKEQTIVLAEAGKRSQLIRGEGDAIAVATYAKAYGSNSEFYSLYRSLDAYRTMLNSGNDLMVLQPDGDFFRFFNKSDPGTKR